jgi:hypothetical protein
MLDSRLLAFFNRLAAGRRRRKPPARDWWRRFPGSGSRLPAAPGADDRPDPRLRPGTRVRLKGKPERVRRVVRSEWHRHRSRFVYVVETSARPAFEPYWFADQLEVVRSGIEPPARVTDAAAGGAGPGE